MLVKFNHEVLSSRTAPSFAQVTVGSGDPVALQYKDTLPPSTGASLPYTRLTDIFTGTGKYSQENGYFIWNGELSKLNKCILTAVVINNVKKRKLADANFSNLTIKVA